jgi:hypothetical protein
MAQTPPSEKDLAALASTFGTFFDAPQTVGPQADVVDQIMASGGLEQALDIVRPARARDRSRGLSPSQAAAASVVQEQPAQPASHESLKGNLVESLVAMDPAQFELIKEAHIEAELRRDYGDDYTGQFESDEDEETDQWA